VMRRNLLRRRQERSKEFVRAHKQYISARTYACG
jgi:hypothetical protein